MVVGILGKEDPASGAFEVYEVCYPGLPKQQALPSSDERKGKRYMLLYTQLILLSGIGDKYVAIMSGLNIGSKADIDLNIQLLTEYLSGELGSEQVGEGLLLHLPRGSRVTCWPSIGSNGQCFYISYHHCRELDILARSQGNREKGKKESKRW